MSHGVSGFALLWASSGGIVAFWLKWFDGNDYHDPMCGPLVVLKSSKTQDTLHCGSKSGNGFNYFLPLPTAI